MGDKKIHQLVTTFEHFRAKRFLECFDAYKANKFEKNDTEVIVILASNDIDQGDWQLEITSSKNIIEEIFKIGEYMNP
jgi:hypothetical protein